MNGSGLATPRLMVSLLETYQTENGTIEFSDSAAEFIGIKRNFIVALFLVTTSYCALDYFLWYYHHTCFPIDFTRGKILSKIVKYWARTIFFTAGIKSKIIGLDNIDNSKNYIFAANHSSSLDIPLMLGYIPFWIVPVSKVELKWIPFLGWAMQMGGHVFVDRRNHEKAMSSLKKAKKSLIKKTSFNSAISLKVQGRMMGS